MKQINSKQAKTSLQVSGVLFAVFVLFTLVVKFVDVQAIGPEDSLVGLASINSFSFRFAGSSDIYDIFSDVLAYAAFIYVAGFALLGAYQLVKGKSLKKVDLDIYALGAFYVAVLAFYALFEVLIINYRPVLEDGVLEASYPSSHTMLAICIYATASMQFRYRLSDGKISKIIKCFTELAMLLTPITRYFSGKHWLTDIVGAVLLSLALTNAYSCVLEEIMWRKRKESTDENI